MKQRAKKHLEIALGGNMNITSLKPLSLIEIMTDFAKKEVEAIDYAHSSTLLNNGLKVNDTVEYKSEKYTIITINESEQKAVIKRWNTKWKTGNIPLNQLTKIVL